MKIIMNIYIIIIIFFDFSSQENAIQIKYPNSLILLDSSQVIVAKDGIHFFDSNMVNEDNTKYINFTISKSDEFESLYMTQFENKYDGYIIILINNITYIFDSNKNLIKTQSLLGEINGKHYCIVPYKKEDNKLNFIISYVEKTNIILESCVFDLSNTENNILIDKKTIPTLNHKGNQAEALEGLYCLLMSPPIDLSINNDLLTCFGSVHPETTVFSVSYNPERNLEEIESLRVYQSHTEISYNPRYISAKTNEYKQKALVYIVFGSSPYWATFDYNKNFSDIYKEGLNGNSLYFEYWKINLYYFDQTKEL